MLILLVFLPAYIADCAFRVYNKELVTVSSIFLDGTGVEIRIWACAHFFFIAHPGCQGGPRASRRKRMRGETEIEREQGFVAGTG